MENRMEINKGQVYKSLFFFLCIECLVILPLTLVLAVYTIAFTWGTSLVLVPLLVILLHIPILLIYFIRSKNRSKRRGVFIGLMILLIIWIIGYYQAKKIPYFNYLTGGYSTEQFIKLNEVMAKRSGSKLLWSGNDGACLVNSESDTLTTKESLQDLVLYWNTGRNPQPIKDSALAVHFLIRKLSPFLNSQGRLRFYQALAGKQVFQKYGYGDTYVWVVGTKEEELASVSPHQNSVTMVVPKQFLNEEDME